ncbi:hypothetical protein [Phormidesmis priestleyi]|uniref:hypothetical protein n=1 Tax=Phormidesmis priestleyi TaxID=268141 RepID=UPI000AED123B|nr:hypothetical protein [Phormidesmis priestleyi]
MSDRLRLQLLFDPRILQALARGVCQWRTEKKGLILSLRGAIARLFTLKVKPLIPYPILILI